MPSSVHSVNKFIRFMRRFRRRTVAVLPLADRQFQPYTSFGIIAASIDRAGVRPLLSAHKTAS